MPAPVKAVYHRIELAPTESFTCVEWRKNLKEFRLRFRKEYSLVMIMEGRGARCVGDSLERFQPGEIVLLGPKVPHYWLRDADSRKSHHVSATFDENFLNGALFTAPEAAVIRELLAGSYRGLLFSRNVYASVAPDLLRASRLSGWSRLCLFLEVLGRLAMGPKGKPIASAGFATEFEEQDIGRLTAVCQFVHDMHGKEIREKEAATVAGFSAVGFSRFFRRRMGMTFVAYVNEVRISEACRRLVEQESTIVEIAFGTGFNNLSNFNRQFLRLKGVTPREYRRMRTGNFDRPDAPTDVPVPR